MIEAVTTRDPLFTEQDTAEVLALIEYEAEVCPGCGFPKDDTFRIENTWKYRGHTLQCHACAARKRAEKRLDDLDGVYSYAEDARRREVVHRG